MKDIPVDQHFDAEIKLSGKMELLDKILHEIKQQGQRVLVLFRVSSFTSISSFILVPFLFPYVTLISPSDWLQPHK